MTTPERESILQKLQQNTYLPVLSEKEAAEPETLHRMVIAASASPAQPCGYAHRIGTGYQGTYALYRLRIRYGPQRPDTLTLPEIFLLAEGHFQPLPPVDNG